MLASDFSKSFSNDYLNTLVRISIIMICNNTTVCNLVRNKAG